MAANFEIPTETIQVGKGGSFTIRGMNSEDVVFLTTNYFDDIKVLIADYGKKAKGGVLSRGAVAELVMDLAKRFPMMSAEMISRCADAQDQIDKFRQLSFVKQIEALKAIAVLSVEDGHELKKVAEVVASLLEANGLPLGPLRSKLQTIIETSGNQSAT